MIAFFTAGSMVQVVLSILISVCALAYHVYALPYRESWLNMMQGACLFFIWLTLQAGLMVQNTLPDRNTGDAILVALSIANIVMLVSPVLLGVIAALQVLPESIRRRASIFLVGPDGAAGDKLADASEPYRSDDAPLEIDGWETVNLPPVLGAASAELEAAGAAAAHSDADATHIELEALNISAMQLADLEAWQGNTLFSSGSGAGLSAAPAAVAATLFPPTAAAEAAVNGSSGALHDAPESELALPQATE